MKKEQAEKEEKRGYEAAQETLREGANAQEQYEASLGDLEQESFAHGWQRACREAGAKEEASF